jgi:uncharacterized protein YdeI (YjbR/CyaY-like superfamily)
MTTNDPRVDAYIAKSADFARPILKHLRQLVHATCPEVEETLKWGFPHFLHKGMLCSMAAFKQHCTFGFWKRALLFDEKKGGAKAEEGMGCFGRITSLADLPAEKVLTGYIREAVRLNDTGVKLPARPKAKEKKELAVPDYFLAALRKNEKALQTFENFSHSHQKEYVEWVTEAKRDATRQQRLDTALAWMAEGKPRHWKYVNC